MPRFCLGKQLLDRLPEAAEDNDGNHLGNLSVFQWNSSDPANQNNPTETNGAQK